MRKVISIMLGGTLSVVIATFFLKIGVNYSDSMFNKIGEAGNKRIENSVEGTVYPKVKIVNPSENIGVHFGNTVLYTDRDYSLRGLIYAFTLNGEYLDIYFERVTDEKTGRDIPFNHESGDIVFYSQGIYKVSMYVGEEEYEMRIPVAKRWKK